MFQIEINVATHSPQAGIFKTHMLDTLVSDILFGILFLMKPIFYERFWPFLAHCAPRQVMS